MTDTQVQVMDNSNALQQMTAAEYDMQITTAKRYPRDLQKVRTKALSLATQDTEIARSCFYGLKRGGKRIEGPSVRLAEIMASQWQNLRVQSRVIETTDTMIRAMGIAHDLENNVAYSTEVGVRITDKYGKRYSDDMIVVSGNAACAKAMRNVVFKAVPFAYVKPILEQAKRTAVGNQATLNDRKAVALQKFKDLGVQQPQLVIYLEVNSWEDVGLLELEDLLGAYTAIETGDTTVEETFKPKVKTTAEKPETTTAAAPAGDPGPAESPEEKPKAEKKTRGRPKKENPKEKGGESEQPQDPGPTEPPAESTLPENGAASPNYTKHRQKYNFVKAKLCTQNGTEGTNEFIFKIMKKTGKDLSALNDQEWTDMIAAMEKQLEASK